MRKEIAIYDQTNILPRKQLITVFFALAFAQLVSFIDQNSLAVALPTVGRDLNAPTTISWAATSSLIATTVFQVLFGRLSDIFGRKVVLLSTMVVLSLSELACGLCTTSTQLFVFRGFAGVGTGGISSLTMMIMSDIVTLEDRGKYQGILGVMVGLGNAIGPFISALFLTHATWRATFYFLCPLTALITIEIFFMVPKTSTPGSIKENAKKIDYWGLLTSSSWIMLTLIPISGGGSTYAWNSPTVIAMLTVGGVMGIAFLFTQWKISRLPMMPCKYN